MNIKTILTMGISCVLLAPFIVAAETAYVDDKLMVGLHQDNDIDSPIIKLIPSGTSLTVIQADEPLTEVQEPAGASGWIDNRYLTHAAPGNARLQSLKEQVGILESELATLRTTSTGAPAAEVPEKLAALEKENAELQLKLQSEQLRAGEMEARAAELRNQLNNAGVSEPDTRDDDTETESGIDTVQFALGPFDLNARSIFIGMIACIILGLIGGIAVMDWNHRRRHGGFRI